MLTQSQIRWIRSRFRCPAAADDVIQECSIALWRAGAAADSPAGWCIVRREAFDQIRRTVRRERRVRSHALPSELAAVPAGEPLIDHAEIRAQYDALLDSAGALRPAVESWIHSRIADPSKANKSARAGLDKIRSVYFRTICPLDFAK